VKDRLLRGALPLVVLSALAVLGEGCRSGRKDGPIGDPIQRIVLVSIDTLHVNSVSPYNPAVRTTPFLQRFATEGVRFERVYALAPVTLPSHTAILTGVSPLSLGVLANGDRVPESATTLAEIFQHAGFRTAAFVSLGVLGHEFGLDQGFMDFHDPFGPDSTRWYRTADEVLGPVEAWIEKNRENPFFVWVHFSDPHEPYLPVGAPPDSELFLDGKSLGKFCLRRAERLLQAIELPPGEHRLRFTSLRAPRPDDRPETAIVLRLLSTESLSPYASSPLPADEEDIPLSPSWDIRLVNDGSEPREVELSFTGGIERPTPEDVLPNYEEEVAYTDRYLSKLDGLLETLGLGAGTLFVVVSDHGEGLFRHDILGHASDVYEDQMRIVWMMRGPGLTPGETIDAVPALEIDVAPTLLDLVGLEPTPTMEGRSWVGCLGAGRCPPFPSGRPFWVYAVDHDSRRPEAMAGYRWPYKWMWQHGFPREAYELGRDPWEEEELLAPARGSQPEELELLAERFPSERRRLVEALSRPQPASSSKEEELLRSLGYLGAKRAKPKPKPEPETETETRKNRQP
jgi:arylsulfatase A-like enzyme